MMSAGKTPKWDQAFNIDVRNLDEDIFLKVFDEDVASSDLIGESTFKLSTLCDGDGIDQWITILYKGDQAGTVHLKSTWRLADTKFRNSPTAKPSMCMTGLSQSQIKKIKDSRAVKAANSQNILGNAKMASIVANYISSKNVTIQKQESEESHEIDFEKETGEDRLRPFGSMEALDESKIPGSPFKK